MKLLATSLIYLVITVAVIMWFAAFPRMLTLLILPIGILGITFSTNLRKRIYIFAFFGLLFLSGFLPFDITFRQLPGSPRFVPLVMGLPGPKLLEKAKKGECILGGCMVSGGEPKWLWVW